MARSDRQVPNVYFGAPGSLMSLPWPGGDISAPYDRPTYDFETGAGQHHVANFVSGNRPYSLKWKALHQDTYTKLEQYWTNMNGPGPWVFVDPSRPNLHRVNVASATGTYRDNRWWTTAGAAGDGTVSSNSDPAQIHRSGANRSVRWTFGAAPVTFPVLYTTAPYRSWFGYPVVPGLSYAHSSWVKPDGTIDTSITLELQLRWLDKAGAQMSITAGGTSAVTTWQRLSVIGTAPAGAAYVQTRWVATGSTIVTGGSLYVDEPLFEQDSVVNDWAPGTGIRPVGLVSLTDGSVPFATRMRSDISMELRELAQ
jgi:hypothetical protein